MSRDGLTALPRGAMGLSAVCDCGISWSYSLTISNTSSVLFKRIVSDIVCIGKFGKHWKNRQIPYRSVRGPFRYITVNIIIIWFLLCCLCFVFVSWSTSELRMRLVHHQTGLSPPVKYLTDHSKAFLLLWIFYVLSVLCLLCLCTHLFICALSSPSGKGLTSWLSFEVYNCEFATFPLVSWVRCGTWLYRFLVFAPLLTFIITEINAM